MSLAIGADSPHFERGGFVFKPLAVPSRGSAELAIWTVDLPPGVVSELHSMDREEVFVVLDGGLSATVGGELLAAGPGDAIIVPANTLLELRSSGADAPARVLAVTSVGMKGTVGDSVFAPPWAQ